MAIVYIAEGIVYMAASYRDAGRVGDVESIKGIWRPNPGNVADGYIARGG